jgi:hypothetical protein
MPRIEETLEANKQKNKQTVRGPGGVLSQETTEGIQSLADKAGLQAPPITPLGAAALGANAHQQKMQGTPNQKQAALQLSLKPTESLDDTTRRKQARTEQTAAEQQQAEKSQTIQQLGALGDRVHSLIQGETAKLAQQTQPVAVDSANEFAGKDITALKPLLAQLRADPTNMQLQVQVNQALGRDVSNTLQPEEINNLYRSATDSIAQGVAGSIDDQITASDLIERGELGYTAEQLSELLGVPTESVGSLSVGQIRDLVGKLADEEFSNTQAVDQQANSSLLGTAERGLARELGRDMSATGVRSTEADVARIEDSIRNADVVQFGGRSYKVDELLQDENLSSVIAEYLNSPPDSEIRKQMDASEPGLVQFIKQNQTLLAEASKQLSESAGEFQKIQKDNQQAATLNGMLDPAIAAKLIPGYNELSAGRIDATNTPVLAWANQQTDAGKQQFTQNLNGLATEFPELLEEVGQLTPEELDALQLNSPSGKWQQYAEETRRYNELVSVQDENILDLVSQIYDVDENYDWTQEIQKSAAVRALGFTDDPAMDMLDADKDGRIDSAEDIKQRVLQGRPTLKGIAAGQKSITDPTRYDSYQIDPQLPYDEAVQMIGEGDPAQIEAGLYKSLGGAAADGHISSDDLNRVVPKPTASLDSLFASYNELNYLRNKAQLEPEVTKKLDEIIQGTKVQASSRMVERETAELDSKWKDPMQMKPKDVNKTMTDLDIAIRVLEEENGSKFMDRATIDKKLEALRGRKEEFLRYQAYRIVFHNKGQGRIPPEMAEYVAEEKQRRAQFQKNEDRKKQIAQLQARNKKTSLNAEQKAELQRLQQETSSYDRAQKQYESERQQRIKELS